jgi:hypothetical protein
MSSTPFSKSFFAGAALFCIAVAVGGFFGRKSWNGAIYLTSTSFTSNVRNPAAVHRDLDFTRLDGSELITGTHNRLVTAARILLEKNEMGIELGHFVTRDEQGNKQLACEYYDRMRLTFEAEGIASSGERPLMIVEGPCRTGADITRIEPIWIPVMKIISEKPSDMDLTFPDDDGVSFKFKDMTSEWPRRWHLTSVRVFNDAETNRSIEISNDDLLRLGGKPVVLAWPSKFRLPTSSDSGD